MPLEPQYDTLRVFCVPHPGGWAVLPGYERAGNASGSCSYTAVVGPT